MRTMDWTIVFWMKLMISVQRRLKTFPLGFGENSYRLLPVSLESLFTATATENRAAILDRLRTIDRRVPGVRTNHDLRHKQFDSTDN
jgi:hypothetical protein